jgi:hypothetical protein
MKKLLVGALIALFGLLGAGVVHHYNQSVSRADMYAPGDMYHSPQDMY